MRRRLLVFLLLIPILTVGQALKPSSGSGTGREYVNPQTGAAYTIASSDLGKLITLSNAGAIAVTLPRCGVTFKSGFWFDIQNTGAGAATITPTVSTIDGAASLSLTTAQGARVVCNAAGNYATMRGITAAVAGVGTVTNNGNLNPSANAVPVASGATELTASACTITAGVLTCGLTGNVTGDVTGNASTATALAANPTDCAANAYAQSIAANGNLTCKQVAQSDLSAGNYTIGSYYVDMAEIAAPANPGASTCRLWIDSTSHVASFKNSAGASCWPSLANLSSHAFTDLSAGNIPVGAYYLDQIEIAAPANPAANTCRMWVDSTTHQVTFKNSAGANCLASSGGAPTTATYITQTADGTLSNEQALSALATGLVKVTNGTGVLSAGAAADVTTLFSGAGDYLKSDGTKGTPAGSGSVSANNSSNARAVAVYAAAGGSTTVGADTGCYTDGAGAITCGSFNTSGTGPDTFTAIADGTTANSMWLSSTTANRFKAYLNATTQTFGFLSDNLGAFATGGNIQVVKAATTGTDNGLQVGYNAAPTVSAAQSARLISTDDGSGGYTAAVSMNGGSFYTLITGENLKPANAPIANKIGGGVKFATTDITAPGAEKCAAFDTNGKLIVSSTNAACGTSTGMTNPMTTTGDMVYSSDNSGTAARLAIGSATQVLHGGTTPAWGALVAADMPVVSVAINTASASVSVSSTLSSGFYFNHHGTAATAVTYTLPTAAAGKQFCFANGNGAGGANTGALQLNTSAAGQYIIADDGTLTASGGHVQSAGAAGDAACVVGADATHWRLFPSKGTWTKD